MMRDYDESAFVTPSVARSLKNAQVKNIFPALHNKKLIASP